MERIVLYPQIIESVSFSWFQVLLFPVNFVNNSTNTLLSFPSYISDQIVFCNLATKNELFDYNLKYSDEARSDTTFV